MSLLDIGGFLIIDKPSGMTSTRVGGILKRLLRTKKIGHVGTLDPLASGVLIMAIKEATKLISYRPPPLKEYLFTIHFGELRATDDLEGEILATSTHRPSIAEIERILSSFKGTILQRPPYFSALHILGKRAYDLAREGQFDELDKALKEREVQIVELEIQENSSDQSLSPPGLTRRSLADDAMLGSGPRMTLSCVADTPPEKTADSISLRVLCTQGTYVRSLARDISEKLGTVGYVSYLRRTRDGNFKIEDTTSLEELDVTPSMKGFCSMQRFVSHLPCVDIKSIEAEKLRQGQKCFLNENVIFQNLAFLTYQGQSFGLAEANEGYLIPKRIFV